MDRSELIKLNKQLKPENKRYCSKCDTIKLLTEFGNTNSNPYCTTCTNEYFLNRYHTNEEYKEQHKVNQVVRNTKIKLDPVADKAAKEYSSTYYETRVKPNTVKVANKKVYSNNYHKARYKKDAVYTKKYKANKLKQAKTTNSKLHKINTRMQRRCAGHLSKQDLTIVKALFITCAYCGGPLGKYHLDHIVPIKDRGTTALGNISRVCSSCNLSKGAKDFDTWYLEQPFFDTSRYLIIKQYQSLYNK